MNIAIWGNELISWVAATALAKAGNHIYFCPCINSIDSSATTPEAANNEPGLIDSFQQQCKAGNIKSNAAELAHTEADIHCLGFSPEQYLDANELLLTLSSHQHSDLLIINFSNFGIGKTQQLQQLLDQSKQQMVAYIPDQLTAGAALDCFRNPSLMVVGTENKWATEKIKTLFKPFQGDNPWQYMSPVEAEYTKFAISGMLALRLAYINDLANLAEQFDVDIETVRTAMGMDERIGQHYLAPGCGFGGQHFPQYIEGLADTLSEIRHSSLLNNVLAQNETQKEMPFRKLWRHYDCQLKGKTISLWGLAFKPGTASIANAPSLKVITALLAQGCTVLAHDPLAAANIENHFKGNSNSANLILCADKEQTLSDSDGLLLLTEWQQYSNPDYADMLTKMNAALIIDGRNLFNKETAIKTGFTYYGVGR